MNAYTHRFYYRRHLPHFQPPGSCLFVTFRLTGSLPLEIVNQLKRENQLFLQNYQRNNDDRKNSEEILTKQKQLFNQFDTHLDRSNFGPQWLKEPAIAQVVSDSLHFLNGNKYDMDAYCIMPNHVHTMFTPLQKEDKSYYSLEKIMHSLKRHTALESNKILNRGGAFWQHESYDHVVRDRDEWTRILMYIVQNPVKAGLAKSWEDWPYSWVKEDFLGQIR